MKSEKWLTCVSDTNNFVCDVWWWSTSPVKHCMLSCSTESVSSKIRYPFLQSLESGLVRHY